MDRSKVLKRWREHYKVVSNAEFPHPRIPRIRPTQGPEGPHQQITLDEVGRALKEMKSEKATGPDDLAVELWKSHHWSPERWLTRLFNKIIEGKETPDDWQRSTTIPIWKGKGNLADCANYRPIRLLSHSMKVYERVIANGIREIARVSINQCGFVPKCGTIDAIHAARLLIERHREKQKPLHIAFLDLEKAFDRVPHKVIWYALRDHGVPEEIINWVRLLYQEPRAGR